MGVCVNFQNNVSFPCVCTVDLQYDLEVMQFDTEVLGRMQQAEAVKVGLKASLDKQIAEQEETRKQRMAHTHTHSPMRGSVDV